jgi:hypothetical protein
VFENSIDGMRSFIIMRCKKDAPHSPQVGIMVLGFSQALSTEPNLADGLDA